MATKKNAQNAPDSTAPTGLAIRRVPIDSLHNDPANARAHDERNLDAITASLKRFGQAEPLVVHGPTGRVIGGNGRLVAMRKLGWTEVDVVQLEVDDLEATALGIALNRTAELATWDDQALALLLKTALGDTFPGRRGRGAPKRAAPSRA